MLIDARKIENNTLIEGDICIIGAGAAGISVALEWINTPFRVVLLESGGFSYEEKIQDLYKGQTTGQKYFPLKSTRLHYFGGTTGHWAGYCSQFDEIDFKKRDWVDYSGWPINKKDFDPFYDRAKDYLDLYSNDYSVSYWKKRDPSFIELPLNGDVVWNKMWQFSPPTRFASKYKDKIINSNNIRLYTYATLTNISGNESVSNIEKMEIRNHAGKTHFVKAKYFILACGGIQNPRLLLASNKQSPKGLGNDNDTVGRFFMEHLEIKSAEMWLSRPLTMHLYEYKHGETIARAELAISAAAQEKHRILNGTASFSRLFEARHDVANMDVWTNEDPRKNILTRWRRLKRKLLVYNESRINNIDKAYELFTRIEQAPNPSSRVTLGSEKDALGLPRANLHWVLTEFEKKSIRKIYQLIGHEIGKAGVGRIKIMEYLQDGSDDTWPSFTSGGWHHIGTTRMSENEKEGVVDSNCKVHGIRNLFVAGSSSFSTAGAVNPTLTVVALSIRISDHIKSLIYRNKI